jgi:hypothetical protein
MCQDDCEEQRELVRSWLSDDHFECAVSLLSGYLEGFRGREFDVLARTTDPFVIEPNDLRAVRRLSVGFPRSFVECLEQEKSKRYVHAILQQIPTGVLLEDLSCEEYGRLLAPGSVASNAWRELANCMKQAGSRNPYVAASKLLAAKRPGLLPLEDSLVRKALKTKRRDIWRVIHCLLRDPVILKGLKKLRRAVPAARGLTLDRILDIVAWRKGRGDRCRTPVNA